MATSKLDLQISLAGLSLDPQLKLRLAKHALTANLLWPRPAIARKSYVHTIDLSAGKLNLLNAPWHQQMLFKESVEGHFGVEFLLSVSLTQIQLARAASYMLGGAMGVGAGILDDFPVWGDLAALPLKYGKKELQAESSELRVLAEAHWDAEASELSADQMTVEIPLLATEDCFRTTRRRTGKEGHAAASRTIVRARGEELGTVTFNLKRL